MIGAATQGWGTVREGAGTCGKWPAGRSVQHHAEGILALWESPI